jgi:hypothetical protein
MPSVASGQSLQGGAPGQGLVYLGVALGADRLKLGDDRRFLAGTEGRGVYGGNGGVDLGVEPGSGQLELRALREGRGRRRPRQ